MKKVFLCIAMLLFSYSIFSQSKLRRDILEAKQTLIVNGYSVNGISNDSIVIIADSLKLVTQYAMKTYVDGNGGSVELSDLITIIGTGAIGDSLRVDTSLIATKTDIANIEEFFPDGITITPTGGAVDTSIIATQYDISTLSTDNIYTVDGTLTGDRTVTMGGNDLSFNGGNVGIGTDAVTAGLHIEKDWVANDPILKIKTTGLFSDALISLDGQSEAGIYFAINGVTKSIMYNDGDDDLKLKSFTGGVKINTGGSDRVNVLSNGDVGIGTTSPSSRTHIVSSGSTTGKSLFVENSLGTDNFTILDNGNVGIGTTTPAQKLDIAGGSVQIDNSHYYRSSTTPGQSVRMLGINSGNAAYIGPIDAGPTASIYNASPTSVASLFYTSGTEKMRIASNGNVGIGTTSPTAKLDVSGGAVRFSDYGSGTITSGTPTYNLAVDADGDVIEVDIPTSTNIYTADGTLTGNRTVTMGGNDLIFNGGNVGIGITAPTENLHVDETIKIESNSAVSTNILLENTGTGDALTTYVIPFAASWSTGVDRSDNLKFKISQSPTFLDQFTWFTIDRGTGHVGIGTSSPTQKLDVSGGTVRFSDYGSGTQTGTVTQILGVDGDGDIIEVGLDENNLYGKDGTLTANRTISSAGQSLTYNAIDGNDINISTFADSNIDFALTDSGSGEVGNYNFTPEKFKVTNSPLEIESTSATAGNILIKNSSSGDAYTSYQIPLAATWSAGIDRSDAINYKISASSVLETNTMLTIERLTSNIIIYSDLILDDVNDVRIVAGTGSPESVVTAGIGSTFHRVDGGAATSFYVKESGVGSTGWIAK